MTLHWLLTLSPSIIVLALIFFALAAGAGRKERKESAAVDPNGPNVEMKRCSTLFTNAFGSLALALFMFALTTLGMGASNTDSIAFHVGTALAALFSMNLALWIFGWVAAPKLPFEKNLSSAERERQQQVADRAAEKEFDQMRNARSAALERKNQEYREEEEQRLKVLREAREAEVEYLQQQLAELKQTQASSIEISEEE